MGRAPDTTQDFGDLRVDVPELRGYSDALDDCSRNLGSIEARASASCNDADFGKIVEDLTGDYATLLPQLKDLLAENESLMRDYALAVDKTAAEYVATDDGVSSRFKGDGISAGQGTANYAVSSLVCLSPTPSEGELPEVSFGFLFDNLCWAIEKISGFDVRARVTDWIAGDVVGLSTQANAWQIVGGSLEIVDGDVTEATARVNKTWDGNASGTHAISMYLWSSALKEQASGFRELGTALDELAKEAVHVAQLVVDCIRLAVDLIASAWSLQYIPVYGQAKFIQKAWHAYKRVTKALAYLKMILSAVRATKSLLVVMIDSFTPTMLPGKPLNV